MNKFIIFSLFLSLSIKSICGVGSEKFSYAQEGELDGSKRFRRGVNYKEPVYAKVNKIPKPYPRKKSKEITYSEPRTYRDAEESDYENIDHTSRNNRNEEKTTYSDVQILPRTRRDSEESDYEYFDPSIEPTRPPPRTRRDSEESDYENFDPSIEPTRPPPPPPTPLRRTYRDAEETIHSEISSIDQESNSLSEELKDLIANNLEEFDYKNIMKKLRKTKEKCSKSNPKKAKKQLEKLLESPHSSKKTAKKKLKIHIFSNGLLYRE